MDAQAAMMFRTTLILLLLSWPPAIYAATELKQALDGVPGAQWLIASGLSTLGGVTAFFFQLNNAFSDPNYKPIPNGRLWVMLISQMLCSWLAGAVVFFLGLHQQMQFFMLGATVAVGSFMGAKAIEIVAGRMFKHER